MLTKSDLSNIGQVVTQTVKPLKQDIGVIKTDVSGLKKEVGGIKKTLDDFIDYFDKSYLEHEKRINYIENHLQLTHPLGI